MSLVLQGEQVTKEGMMRTRLVPMARSGGEGAEDATAWSMRTLFSREHRRAGSWGPANRFRKEILRRSISGLGIFVRLAGETNQVLMGAGRHRIYPPGEARIAETSNTQCVMHGRKRAKRRLGTPKPCGMFSVRRGGQDGLPLGRNHSFLSIYSDLSTCVDAQY